MKTKLIITEYKIRKARKDWNQGMNSRTCPIAQAVKQNGIEFDIVDTDSIKLMNGKKIMLSEDAKEFIENFDNRNAVYPTTFEIDIPKKYFKKVTPRIPEPA